VKEYLAELVRVSPTPAHGQNVAREYLQARILGSLQRVGAMIPLAFHGGTALRFLYASARYSEDLDFALERARPQYDFRAYLQAIQKELAAEGYTVELKVSDQKVVHSAFVRFAGLLYELGLSPHRDQVLAVKVEVDTNPPAGAVLTTTVVRRHVTLQLQHHDRASLLAGKLHAVLQRPYLKGRDVYDLMWYLSDPDWPAPNLTLLSNALQQTGWQLARDGARPAASANVGSGRGRCASLLGAKC
jgi:predicted nucleotidyltransferase component of viral defense system